MCYCIRYLITSVSQANFRVTSRGQHLRRNNCTAIPFRLNLLSPWIRMAGVAPPTVECSMQFICCQIKCHLWSDFRVRAFAAESSFHSLWRWKCNRITGEAFHGGNKAIPSRKIEWGEWVFNCDYSVASCNCQIDFSLLVNNSHKIISVIIFGSTLCRQPSLSFTGCWARRVSLPSIHSASVLMALTLFLSLSPAVDEVQMRKILDIK